MLAGLDKIEQNLALDEVAEALAIYETPESFSGPRELAVASGRN